MQKKTLTIQIDSDILDQFKNYCTLNALMLSAKIELLLKQEMENAKNNPTLIKLFKEILNNHEIKKESRKPDQTHIQYAPKSDIKEIIKDIKRREELKSEFEEQKGHIISGDIRQIIKDVSRNTTQAPSIDELRNKKRLQF